MRDDFLSADWADNHARIGVGLDHFVRLVAESFERLTAIRFDAPWQQPQICDPKRG